MIGLDQEPEDGFSLSTLVHLGGSKCNSLNAFSLHEVELQKQGLMRKSASALDQAELMQTIRETMIGRPSPQDGRKPNRTYFISAIATQIRRRYRQLASRDIEIEINRLNEFDSQIQAILAERTEG